MSLLDILLLAAGWSAWVFSFMSGNDSLHKLFLGLIIGFLMYALVSAQIDLAEALNITTLNSYQLFLSKNSTGILSFMLILVPILWLFFMLSSRLSIETQAKNFSHLLLWLLLPVFLVGVLSFLWDGSLLSDSPTWKRVFWFFESSSIYQIFKTLPWALFALLGFLVFYKTFFAILINFCVWMYTEVLPELFQSWKQRQKRKASTQRVEAPDEEE